MSPKTSGGNDTVDGLLAAYPDAVRNLAGAARKALAKALPGVAEGVDMPAKMLSYSYGPGYKGLVGRAAHFHGALAAAGPQAAYTRETSR